MKLEYNYHTHTSRCGHALGEDEDYVKSAIKCGMKELGFSDHAPFPNISQRGVRMEYYELDNYIESINSLKEKYKDQIKIFVGFEIEYYHEIDDYYKELLKRVDYLICGQHFALHDKEQVYVGYKHDDEETARNYFDRVIEAIESGLFKYIAHPDIILRSYTLRNDFLIGQIRRLCEAAQKHHIPFELNLEGMRKQVLMDNIGMDTFYPFPYFWKIVSEYDIDVIIGGDFHDPQHFFEDYDKYAYEMAEKYNLKLIKKIIIN